MGMSAAQYPRIFLTSFNTNSFLHGATTFSMHRNKELINFGSSQEKASAPCW